MNERKIIIKGMIAENEEILRKLEIKIENYAKDVSYSVSTLSGVENINIDVAEVMFNELKKALEEYKKIKEELRKLKEEL
ncbi:MAG: hypothetical protein QXJ28_00640 [Candidatus Pacearchaeota archaeon]